MFKKCFAVFMMFFAIVFAFTGLSSTAFADALSTENISTFSFTTGDGEWDGSVSSSSSFNVNIEVDAPLADALMVRLCNADTGNCTQFNSLSIGGSTEFRDILPGTYYGDIVSKLAQETSGYVTYRYVF